MKILLACLMCLVLSAAECFALKGGPPYPGTVASITGTYAGTLQGIFDPTNAFPQNTLGLFSLSIGSSGLGSGVVVIFVSGRTFVGTISAMGDPNKSKVTGILQATTQTTLVLCNSLGSPVAGTVTDHADGTLRADIRRTSRSVFSPAGTLLIGTASTTATLSKKNPTDCTLVDAIPLAIEMALDGFKQTNS